MNKDKIIKKDIKIGRSLKYFILLYVFFVKKLVKRSNNY